MSGVGLVGVVRACLPVPALSKVRTFVNMIALSSPRLISPTRKRYFTALQLMKRSAVSSERAKSSCSAAFR